MKSDFHTKILEAITILNDRSHMLRLFISDMQKEVEEIEIQIAVLDKLLSDN